MPRQPKRIVLIVALNFYFGQSKIFWSKQKFKDKDTYFDFLSPCFLEAQFNYSPGFKFVFQSGLLNGVAILTLLGLGLIKINDVSSNFNNPRPSLILNN